MPDSSYSYKFLNDLADTFNTTPEDISKVQAEVDALKTEVSENTDAIGQNTGDIAANTANILQAKTDIAANTADIEELKARPAGTEVNSIAPLTVAGAAQADGDYAFAAGNGAQAGDQATAIGNAAQAHAVYSTCLGIDSTVSSAATAGVAIGYKARCRNSHSVALGLNSTTTREFEVNVADSNYPSNRFLAGVADPELDQDAATKHYVDAKIANIPSGSSVNSIAPASVDTPPTGGAETVSIGNGAQVSSSNGVAIGNATYCGHRESAAIGNSSTTDREFTVSVGSVGTLRKLAFVGTPEKETDGVNKKYVDDSLSNHVAVKGDSVSSGHVKITHTVTNDSTDGVAVSPDAVYAYCPAKGQAVEGPFESASKVTALETTSDFKAYSGDCEIYGSKNGFFTGHIVLAIQTGTSVPSTPVVCSNATGVSLPVTVLSSAYGTLTPVGSVASGHIDTQGRLVGTTLPQSGMCYIVSFFGQLNVRSN